MDDVTLAARLGAVEVVATSGQQQIGRIWDGIDRLRAQVEIITDRTVRTEEQVRALAAREQERHEAMMAALARIEAALAARAPGVAPPPPIPTTRAQSPPPVSRLAQTAVEMARRPVILGLAAVLLSWLGLNREQIAAALGWLVGVF